jgi:membrane-associated phospholipid phosphatase
MIRTLKKFWATLGLISLELLIVLALFVVSLLAFGFITYNIFRLDETNFDANVFISLRPYITETNTQVMNFITFFATHTFLLPANIILAFYFVFKRHRWYSIKVPVVALSSYLVMALLKLYFSRPRPDDPVFRTAAGFSFPSGHAMSAMTFYGLLIYITWRNVENPFVRWLLTVLLMFFILLIGFSRVYLRVHYASDVLAGFSLGLVWLVLSLWIMKKIETYTRKEIAPAVEVTEQKKS